jgi:hypothetical protein
MIDGDKAAHVTRREFYPALCVVWLYIALVIGDLLRVEWRWTTQILFFLSIFMVFAYALTTFRLSRTGGAAARKELPPSDRVKEIARDPARKIEAIKAYRAETGAGLAEAKEMVEAYIDSL